MFPDDRKLRVSDVYYALSLYIYAHDDVSNEINLLSFLRWKCVYMLVLLIHSVCTQQKRRKTIGCLSLWNSTVYFFELRLLLFVWVWERICWCFVPCSLNANKHTFNDRTRCVYIIMRKSIVCDVFAVNNIINIESFYFWMKQ